MSWALKGSYVETCSCDLICPCNANMAHGATYDYCRVCSSSTSGRARSTGPT